MAYPTEEEWNYTYEEWNEMNNKKIKNMTKKELQDKLMEMPELETQEEEITKEKIGELYDKAFENGRKAQAEDTFLEDELIHKRMNDINTFQAHENEVYLRGTDEYGKDFQICFDSYNFLEWIDTEHLKYIKKQLIKHIKTK
jgi:hypothetical protein